MMFFNYSVLEKRATRFPGFSKFTFWTSTFSLSIDGQAIFERYLFNGQAGIQDLV